MTGTLNEESLNHYLQGKNYFLQKEYLYGSAFFVGWRVETSFFSLAYRLVDGQELILCHFEARNNTGLNGPVLSLTRFLEDLYRQFSGIKKISAMKATFGTESECFKRNELFLYFQKKGANIIEDQDETWFVLNVNNR
ncbi:hypothetical protein ACK2DA_000674 [Salmonella enterica]|nr:hypothetical protein [Salmonella enterica]ECC2863068.1 hypothetical protein [Salmonella enterica subsp. enterica]EEO7875669.1 hypothetical protein [Salmonella enterica]EHG3963369.1 hypothetical protein [Salmonella enterica]EJZ1562360.1 hypothetical protein [Salmonella enterica]